MYNLHDLDNLPLPVPKYRFDQAGNRVEAYDAHLHLDLDGTADHPETSDYPISEEPIALILRELCSRPSFAQRIQFIQKAMKEMYSSQDARIFANEVTKHFVDSGVKIDFLNESIEKGVDKWRGNDDLHSFLMEDMAKLHVQWRWDSANFEYAIRRVNKKYDLSQNIFYCTRVEYDKVSGRITRIFPNVMRRKLARIERDLDESRISRRRFIFLGDSPQEEPYSAKIAALALWVRENADLTKSQSKINIKIPEARYGFSKLTPYIHKFILECDENERKVRGFESRNL